MRSLCILSIFCGIPSFVFGQDFSKEYILECVTDISAIYTLSSTLRDVGYDVSLENLEYLENLRKSYLTIGVMSGVLDGNKSGEYLKDHQAALKGKIDGMKVIITRRGEVGALKYLAERHATECKKILEWKPQ